MENLKIDRKLLNELIQGSLLTDKNVFEKSNEIIDILIYYKLLNEKFNNDEISIPFLMSLHNLNIYDAKDLLDYCHKNTIKHKICYGNGSIMFNKWINSK